MPHRLAPLLLLLPGLAACSSSPAPSASSARAVAPAGIDIAHSRVLSGLQPVTGSTVQLFIATSAGTTSLAAPLTSDLDGFFDASPFLSCPAGSFLFLTATGGNPGLPARNPNLAEMTALGPCASFTPAPIAVNELTTVAAVFALAPFLSSPSSLSFTPASEPALTQAFTLAAQFADPVSGASPGAALAPGDSAPTPLLNTLADILSACVHSTGGAAGDPTPCGQLFHLTSPPGGPAPTDSLAAALDLARNTALNTAALFALAGTSGPFQPILPATPPDFTPHLLQPASAPALTLAPTTLVFPDAAPQTATLLNPSATPVHLRSLTLTGPDAADFTPNSTCGPVLLPGASCTVTITVAATATTAPRTAALAVVSDAAPAPQTLPLTATAATATTATRALLLSPAALTFYEPAQIASVALTNTGTRPVQFSSISISSPAWTLGNTCGASLAPGATCLLTVTAAATGMVAGNLLITGSEAPQSVPLRSDIRPTVALLDFGPALIGQDRGLGALQYLHGALAEPAAIAAPPRAALLLGPNSSDFTGTGTRTACQSRTIAACPLAFGFVPSSPGLRYSYIQTDSGELYLLRGLGLAPAAPPLVASGLLASLPFTGPTGQPPTDESPAHLISSFCPGTQAPTSSPAGLLFNADLMQCFHLAPSLDPSTVHTVAITYFVPSPFYFDGFQSRAYPTFLSAANPDGFSLASADVNMTYPKVFAGTSCDETGIGTRTFVFTSDGTSTHLYLDGAECHYTLLDPAYDARMLARSTGPLTVGVESWFPGNSAFEGTLYYMRLFSRALLPAEVVDETAAERAAVTARGVSFTPSRSSDPTPVLVTDGDSRTAGHLTAIPYATFLNHSTNLHFRTTVSAQDAYQASGLSRITPASGCLQFSPSAPHAFAVIWEGTNDMAAGRTASDTWADIRRNTRVYCACGFNTVLVNEPARITTGLLDQSLNAFWKDLWPGVSDGFVDLGQDPNLGSINAYTNQAFYLPDGSHFSNTGAAYIADKIAREINFLTGSNAASCRAVPSTSTYALADRDGCTSYDLASTSTSVALYDANDFTGRIVTLRNPAQSTHTLTVLATPGQTIDGASSITIPPGTARSLQVVSNGIPGSGDSWHTLP